MEIKNDSSLCIVNGRILASDGSFISESINIYSGLIESVGPEQKTLEKIDAKGAFVIPGLIDIHTHGIRMEKAMGDLIAYAKQEAAAGATTCLPTLFGPPDEIAACLKRHLEETDSLNRVPNVAGFHLESPYIAKTGAGLAEDLSSINRKLTDILLKAGDGHIKIWDVSPELPGAADEIQYLSDKNIICGIAHTRATIEQARTAVEAGARLVIHLFDTFEMPYDTALKTGVYPAALVDYLLIDDRLVCEIIPDGTHAHPMLVEKALRCKTIEKIAFITDGSMCAGLPPGEYTLSQKRGRALLKGPNDGVRMIDRKMSLAGSALTPIDCLKNAVMMFGRNMAEAIRLCSRNQAVLLGLNKGEIKEGRDADLLILDADFNILFTIVGGKIVYHH